MIEFLIACLGLVCAGPFLVAIIVACIVWYCNIKKRR
jgi:hypothetical protein